MNLFSAFGFTNFYLTLPIILEISISGIVLFILSLTLLVLILYSYIFFRSCRWILRWYGAQKIERNERSLLYSILEELSKKAGVVTPEILSFESKIPSMFTIGSGSKSFLVISTAMLKMFDELELEALLAHEIGHIKNDDVGLNTVTAFLAGLIMSFPDFAMWSSLLIGFGQPVDPAPSFFKFMATALVAPPAAIIVHLTNPAKKEYAADEMSIKLTGNPRALAKTIEYLESYIPLQPVTGRFNPGHFHLFSTHTQQIRGHLSIFISLFDTHPGIEDRVTNILKYSNHIEKATSNSNYSRVPGYFDLRSWKLAMAISILSYIVLFFGIILISTLVMKGFHSIVNVIVAVVYIGAVILLMSTTARITRRGHRLR